MDRKIGGSTERERERERERDVNRCEAFIIHTYTHARIHRSTYLRLSPAGVPDFAPVRIRATTPARPTTTRATDLNTVNQRLTRSAHLTDAAFTAVTRASEKYLQFYNKKQIYI